MRDEQISESEALNVMKRWQAEGHEVEVVLRFSEGLTQTHAGRLTVQPEGQAVIAQISSNQYFTTVLDLSAFDSIRLLESTGAITFLEREQPQNTFKSVTVAVLPK
jgi:hypothetical protein